jgi:desulfoferrodoxin (superoxide reductase-like protein)
MKFSFSKKGFVCFSLFVLLQFPLNNPSFIFASESVSSEEVPELAAIETPMEKEHRPRIQAPRVVKKSELFMVSVQIGEKLHVSTDDHAIEWVEVSLNGEKVLHLTLYPGIAEPRITFPLRIQKDAVLKVEANCNKYGTWGREVPIRVRS